MAETRKDGCQIITSDMKYNDGLADYIQEAGLGADANKYHVVSIIGGQSSGKSTLLNKMFGTSFDMMDSQRGRSQTTKGIWCARAAGSHTLVLDVEGTDGREKEDQKAFEGKSALFCLAFTDVLMVNMWMHEVGRFNAANLPLLKTVFEAHLRLLSAPGSTSKRASGSAAPGRPLLLFVLRDCDGTTPVEKLRETILTDLARLWSEARKPEALAGAALEELFDVECEALPHYVYQKEEWVARVGEVGRRFSDPAHAGWVFAGRKEKSVPAESFSDFAMQVWEIIDADQDLDLPTQRRMLSLVRCDARRKACLEPLRADCRAGGWASQLPPASFCAEAQARERSLVAEFLEGTAGYEEDVREEGRARLSDEAWELLSDRFDALVRAEREEAQAKGRGVLEALLPSGHGMPPKHFEGLLTGAVSAQLAAFEARAGALIPEGAPWAETLDENEGALALLRAALLREADVLRAAYAQRLVAAVLRSNCKRLSDHLVVLLDAAEPDMWEAIRAAHGKSVAASLAAIEAGLTDVGLWEPGAQADEVRERFDALVHDKVGDKAAEGSMADRIFHKFDSHYNRGRSRVWRMLWDDPIKEFEAARAKALHLLSMFAASQLYEEGEWPAGLGAPEFIDEKRQGALTQAFLDKTGPELRWAETSKAASSTQSTLLVAGVIFVLGFDELLYVLQRPLLLLAILAACLAAAGYYLVHYVADWKAVLARAAAHLVAPVPAGGPPAAAGDEAAAADADLAHAAGMAGPPGRQKRPATYPGRRNE